MTCVGLQCGSTARSTPPSGVTRVDLILGFRSAALFRCRCLVYVNKVFLVKVVPVESNRERLSDPFVLVLTKSVEQCLIIRVRRFQAKKVRPTAECYLDNYIVEPGVLGLNREDFRDVFLLWVQVLDT